MNNHSHTRLHILISILAFVLVAGSITLYQIQKVKAPDHTDISKEKIIQKDLTTEQRSKIIADMKNVQSKSPPLTDTQRAKIIVEMKKANSK